MLIDCEIFNHLGVIWFTKQELIVHFYLDILKKWSLMRVRDVWPPLIK